MIYCVVPAELEGELFEQLSRHYADDPNVTVIVERRKSERRRAGEPAPEGQRRELRDRRRRRVVGDLPDLKAG